MAKGCSYMSLLIRNDIAMTTADQVACNDRRRLELRPSPRVFTFQPHLIARPLTDVHQLPDHLRITTVPRSLLSRSDDAYPMVHVVPGLSHSPRRFGLGFKHRSSLAPAFESSTGRTPWSRIAVQRR